MNEIFLKAFQEELSKQAALPASVLKLLRGGHKWLLPKWTKSMLSGGAELFHFGKGSIKKFHKAMPGMYKWWRKGVGVSPIKAGIKAIKHGAKVSPIGAGLTAGIGGLGLGGLGLGFRKLKQRTKTGAIINDFEQGFNEELEKISVEGDIPQFFENRPVLSRVIGGTIGGAALAPVAVAYTDYFIKFLEKPSFRKYVASIAGLGALAGAAVGLSKGIRKIVSQKEKEK